MTISKQIHDVNVSRTIIRRADDVREKGDADKSDEGGIPHRYRDEPGGIDLEQIRQDQRQARRLVLRSMIRRLLKFRR